MDKPLWGHPLLAGLQTEPGWQFWPQNLAEPISAQPIALTLGGGFIASTLCLLCVGSPSQKMIGVGCRGELGDSWCFGTLRMGGQRGKGDLLACAGFPSPSPGVPDHPQGPPNHFLLRLCFPSKALTCPSVAFFHRKQRNCQSAIKVFH